MAEETFTCHDCGRQFPVRKLKEHFEPSGEKIDLCPEDLDERMNKEQYVRGGPGKEKAAASYAKEAPQDAPYGLRAPPPGLRTGSGRR